VLETHYVRRPPPNSEGSRSAPQARQVRAAWDAYASWARKSRAGRRARRNAVINDNRRAGQDFRAFRLLSNARAGARFGEFASQAAFEPASSNPALDYVSLRHDDRGAAVDNRTHR